MKALVAFVFLISLFDLKGKAFCLQAATPEAALEEMVTTDKLETLARHLPVKVEEAINKLDPKRKEELSKKIVVKNLMNSEHRSVHKADDGVTWEVRTDKGELEGLVKLENTFVSGIDAFVALSVREKNALSNDGTEQPESKNPSRREKASHLFLISMRLEEGDWRLLGIGPWEPKMLEAQDILREIAHHGGNEDGPGADTLRTLNTMLSIYRTRYPQTGLPSSLDALSGAADVEASPDHAKLLDPSFMATPLIRSGYRFEYTLLDAGNQKDHEPRYQIRATPLEFGKMPSFFTDQTAIIRVTPESRDASENDPPLQEN